MGCGQSRLDPDERNAIQKNARIEKSLRKDKKVDDRTVKILLLGMFACFDGLAGK